jgi:hypothetical protein
MDRLSPAVGTSVTVTPGGAQQRVSIPALRALRTVSGTNLAVDGTANFYSGPSGTFSNFKVNDTIDVTGFVTAANNGRKRVTSVNSAGTAINVSDAGLITEAAGASVTITVQRLPTAIMLVSDSIVPKVNLWRSDAGTPPAATTAFFVGSGAPLILDCSGHDQVIVDGASGNVTITALENG